MMNKRKYSYRVYYGKKLIGSCDTRKEAIQIADNHAEANELTARNFSQISSSNEYRLCMMELSPDEKTAKVVSTEIYLNGMVLR